MNGTYIVKLKEKLAEALNGVLPVIGIVIILCFSVAPISSSILLCFLLGAAMIVVGTMFFTLGAETAMTPMGERVGTAITKSRNLMVIVVIAFILGFIITISEPDLQVLANQVPSVPNMTHARSRKWRYTHSVPDRRNILSGIQQSVSSTTT